MKDFKEILEKIAKENGTTPENVLQEMQRAIDEAYLAALPAFQTRVQGRHPRKTLLHFFQSLVNRPSAFFLALREN